MPQLKKPKREKHVITLREFHDRRNKVLIHRHMGGLGDLLMHRMIFEDFKKVNPEMKIVFACLPQYFDVVKDHPYIDEIVDANKVDVNEYIISYNTTSCCSRYEMSVAPLADKHRSDIWAGHCGVELKNHNMHISLTEEELEFGKKELAKITNGTRPSVMLCPISAMATKNLLKHQITGVVKELKRMGFFTFSTHTEPISYFDELKVPVIYKLKIREWMSLIMASDYIISVDTAAFHFAGGVGKPVVGIFTWADGYVYGKYYPTATIVQLHRNTHPDWTCGPCYNFSNCPFTITSEKPCLVKITSKMILDGVETMLNKQKFLPIYN